MEDDRRTASSLSLDWNGKTCLWSGAQDGKRAHENTELRLCSMAGPANTPLPASPCSCGNARLMATGLPLANSVVVMTVSSGLAGSGFDSFLGIFQSNRPEIVPRLIQLRIDVEVGRLFNLVASSARSWEHLLVRSLQDRRTGRSCPVVGQV